MSDLFTEDEYRSILEREALIQALDGNEGWQALREFAETLIDSRRREIMGGNLTPDVYVKQAWYVQGVEAVLRLPGQIGMVAEEARRQMAELAPDNEES